MGGSWGWLLAAGFLGVASGGCVAPAEFGSASVEAEDFDADRGLRALRHERSFDFSWVNTRMPHAVQVLIRGRSGRPRVQCNGVLLGPDLVFTAAHCLKNTAYVSDGCVITHDPDSPDGTVGVVVFDRQAIQDESLDVPPSGLRTTRRIGIDRIAAILPSPEVFTPNTDVGRCATAASQRHLDGVLLRLAEPATGRGVARVRTSTPLEEELLPVLHHFSEDATKQFSAVRGLQPDPVTFTNSHIATQAELLGPAGIDAPEIQCGSSGSALLDSEGYVLGVVSGADVPPGGDCFPSGAPIIFSNASSLFSRPEFQLVLPPSRERSGFALGTFAGPSALGTVTLSTSSFGPRAELPRAIVERGGGPLAGGFVTAGFAANAAGQRVLALAGYESDGDPDPDFGEGGTIAHDLDESRNEELFDIDIHLFQGELRPVAVGTLANPDSIAVVGLDGLGDLDGGFGETSTGLTRIDVGDNGASGAAIEVAPDGSIFVAGSASVEVFTEEADGSMVSRGPHESPVVARLHPDGSLDPSCLRRAGTADPPGVFVWRPEGTASLDGVGNLPELAERLPQVRDTVAAPTYDMVVTDMALDAIGGIILVGYLHQQSQHRRQAWVGRLNPDCTPDTSFGGSTTGVAILDPEFLSTFVPEPVDNGWLASVTVDHVSGTIYAAGTLSEFDAARGLFAGQMFVLAMTPVGGIDPTFAPGAGRFGGVVVPADGWHEEGNGIALFSDEGGGEPRVVVAGMSYLDSGTSRRRVRIASYLLNGFPFVPPETPTAVAPVGLVDAWATDVLVQEGGEIVLSVAQRSDPIFDPDPIPPPGP